MYGYLPREQRRSMLVAGGGIDIREGDLEDPVLVAVVEANDIMVGDTAVADAIFVAVRKETTVVLTPLVAIERKKRNNKGAVICKECQQIFSF